MNDSLFWERYNRFLSHFKLKAIDVARALGDEEKHAKYYKYGKPANKGGTQPNFEVIEGILKHYPKLNADWFLRGVGDVESNPARSGIISRDDEESGMGGDTIDAKAAFKLQSEVERLKFENQSLTKQLGDVSNDKAKYWHMVETLQQQMSNFYVVNDQSTEILFTGIKPTLTSDKGFNDSYTLVGNKKAIGMPWNIPGWAYVAKSTKE